MKHYTHPKNNLTCIQTKEGALYNKQWLFFRATLSLEIDLSSHKIWQKNEKIKSFINIKHEKINPINANNSTINS
jgi:hypothetical protein